MKKVLLFVLLTAVVISCAVSLVACNKNDNKGSGDQVTSLSEDNPTGDSQHTHNLTTKFDVEWHWQECACGYKTEKIAHTLVVEYDADGHMRECECGYVTEKASHTLDYEYDADGHWGECVCGYKTTKAAHTLETVYGVDGQWQECLCGYATEKTPTEGFIGVTEPYGYTAEEFSVENFASSGKALTFEYKPVDKDSNTGGYVTFSLMSGWDRLTDYISLNVVNDTVKSGIGKIEDVGDGWKKVTINLNEMTIITTGDETADQMYFQWVDHAFLLKDVAFTAEYRKAIQVDSVCGYSSENFSVDGFSASKKALTFEYKPVGDRIEGENDCVTFSLMSGWNRLTDYISLNVVDNTIIGGIGMIEDVGDGWMRATINISEMTVIGSGEETADFMYFHWVNHAFLLDKVAFTAEYRKAIEINASTGYSAAGFSLAKFANSGKALTFEYKPVGNRIEGDNDYVTFSLMSGWDRLTEYVSLEVVADSIASGIGQIEKLEDGWRRLTINCNELTVLAGKTGEETVDFLYFHWVNHGFLIANVEFTNEYRKATEVNSAWGYSSDGFSVANFFTSGKALTFEFKAVDNDANTGTEVTFSLMSDWTRLTDFITIDIVNDTIKGGIGKVEDLGDGWKKVTIDFSEMTVYTEGAATGAETFDHLYFHWVDHAFLIYNIAVVDSAD